MADAEDHEGSTAVREEPKKPEQTRAGTRVPAWVLRTPVNRTLKTNLADQSLGVYF